MKILLCAINAKYIHTNIAVRLIKGYCLSALSSDIDVVEYTINNYIDDIVQDLYKKSPDVIAFSCYIWNIEMIKKIMKIVKIIMPDVRLIMGGPEVSYNATEVLGECLDCDVIIRGEGERSSLELFSAFENNTDLSNVNGITYRNNDGVIVSNNASVPVDMSDLPFPYDDITQTDNKICYYEASRGCPFNCQYCLSSIEKKVRFAPIEKVKKELKIFIDYKVKQVKFVDRTFNANSRFAGEIIEFIMDNDNGITNFHFEVAAELMTEKLISLLQKARKGLFQLEIGVQSTNEQTLSEISRKGEFEKICDVTGKIKSSDNIHIHLDLIAGLPYENLKSFVSSYNDVYSLRPHQLQLGFLKILHGSGMENMCDKHGIKYSPYAPYEILKTDELSFDDVLFLKEIENMTEKYYNSNRFVHSMEYLIKFCDTPFEMYSKFANFEKLHFKESTVHNKNDSYRFVLSVVKAFDCADIEELKWCLKLDYILHEKPKGTPDWTECCLNIFDKNDVYEHLVRQNIVPDYFPEYSGFLPKETVNYTHIEKMPINPVNLEKKETIILVNYKNRDLYGNAEFMIIG